MTEEKTTRPYVARELDEQTWGDALKNNQCPECKNPLEQFEDPTQGNRYHMGCSKCYLFFRPIPKLKIKPRKDPTVSVAQLEKSAERSGFSRYEPLNIHFFCEKCWQNDMDKLAKKVKRSAEQGLKIPRPTGLEGMSSTLVRNRSRLIEVNLTLPFTCKCKTRYYLDVTLKSRDKKDHDLYGVEMGYHADCMGCPMAWDISVGKEDMTLRCDLNLDCVIIKNKNLLNHFFLVDEDESINEDME